MKAQLEVRKDANKAGFGAQAAAAASRPASVNNSALVRSCINLLRREGDLRLSVIMLRTNTLALLYNGVYWLTFL